MYPYWQKQTADKLLFSDIEWSRPERKDQAGKLAIIGGNKLSFAAIAESYQTAVSSGAGEVRVLVPDVLKKNIPVSMTDVTFAPSNNSGGFSNDAVSELNATDNWADVLLFPGDAGKNSQTAILFEEIIKKTDKPVVLTRDAVDLLQNSFSAILDNPQVVFVVSFAQIQRIFRAVYYPKILTFSMQLAQLVETLHKFTITYPVTIVTLHAEQVVIARDGQVITQAWSEPMLIWRGHTASRIATYLLWTPSKPMEAIATSLISS